jgi:hypothetical protein
MTDAPDRSAPLTTLDLPRGSCGRITPRRSWVRGSSVVMSADMKTVVLVDVCGLLEVSLIYECPPHNLSHWTNFMGLV